MVVKERRDNRIGRESGIFGEMPHTSRDFLDLQDQRLVVLGIYWFLFYFEQGLDIFSVDILMNL